MRLFLASLGLALAGVSFSPSPSAAQQPAPLPTGFYAFPGSNFSPGSALSAGVGLADRWLGDEPFDNPAILGRRLGALTALLHRVSRQDLRAANREYDEQATFIDPAGACFAAPLGALRLGLYGSQAVVRREDNTFLSGEPGGPVAPAVLASTSDVTEIRLGFAAAWGAGLVTLGAAGEFTRRSDHYTATDASSSPTSGTQTLAFDGSGFGGQFGARVDLPRSGFGELSAGIAARYLPALTLTGEQRSDLMFLGSSRSDVKVEREAGWEGGVSVADRVTPAFRVIAGAGGRTARDWKEFGVTSGAAWSAALAVDFHDARDPWTLRFGLGREGERGSRTPSATVIGLGFGWRWNRLHADGAALRRSLQEPDAPTSFDDRVLVGLTQEF